MFAGRLDHPVTCVSLGDAAAFADWADVRLPREAEWEYAATGGVACGDYAWGDTFMPNGERMANTWEGVFPIGSDKGHAVRTSAVGTYPANGFGLLDMIGNVWEWTADAFACETGTSCCGPMKNDAARVIKGGSFLCDASYCARYRPAARQPQ